MISKCLVTGGSRGIGWAVAQRFAANGYNVTLSARNRDLLEQRRVELPVVSETQIHNTWVADFTSPKLEIPQDVASGVNVFVNAAGVAPSALLAARTAQSVEDELRTNLTTPILITRAILRQMLRNKSRQGGSLVYLSSVLGRRGVAGSTAYSAAKAGLEGFARSLAREVGSRGIRVNCVAPGLVDTDMGRSANKALLDRAINPQFIDPDAVADTVMFLINNQSITGQTLVVDNGYTA